MAITSGEKVRLRNIIALMSGAMVCSVVFLLPLYLNGYFKDFWMSYIVLATVYVKNSLSVVGVLKLIKTGPLLTYIFIFIVAVGFVSVLHTGRIYLRDKKYKKFANADVIYLFVLVVIAWFVIARPGNTFPHYVMFLFPFLLIFFGYMVGPISRERSDVIIFARYYALFAIISFSLFYIGSYRHGKYKAEKFNSDTYGTILYKSILPEKFRFHNPRLYSWIPSKINNLLIWGWMPQWHVWSDLSPASRESMTQYEMQPSKINNYYRARFIKDIESSKPGIIIDALYGKTFQYEALSKYTIAKFPEFANIISKGYSQLIPFNNDNDCAITYIRNDIKKRIDSSLIIPSHISASATYGGDDSIYKVSNLFDNSLTEDICTSYWLLPDKMLGQVKIGFSTREAVSDLMILNTQDSQSLDRSTKEVSIEFYAGSNVVSQRYIELRPYPYWTTIHFAKPVISDRLNVNIDAYLGRGAGLNEIKIFRSEKVFH